MVRRCFHGDEVPSVTFSCLRQCGLALMMSMAAILPGLAETAEPGTAEPGTAEPGTANPPPEVTADALSLSTVFKPMERIWGIDFLPDGRAIVTERPGRLSILGKPGDKPIPIEGVPAVFVLNHAGLLDVHLDPHFKDNQLLYLSYVVGSDDSSSMRLMRARLDGHKLADAKIIYEAGPFVPGSENWGGRIAIDGQGFLFLSLGDRLQDWWRAQDLSQSWGKIIRIRTDGAIPEDNPFAHVPGARKEIWSYGHRNPQGLAIDPKTGTLWEVEHGPQGGDEVNIIKPGRNYGWPVITYGIGYDNAKVGIGTHAPGLEQPVYYFKPSIATSGLEITQEGSPWGHALWVGGLATEILVKLTLEGERVTGEERFLEGEIGRVRVVRAAPDGSLYLGADEDESGVYRVAPKQ
ncbi:glucose/arabinose dehydrogenase [Rhodoligotrophos appendicifer]